jgi:(E)-4-hydroxy-3-methylbut-2-enyl-diphosphate synthase
MVESAKKEIGFFEDVGYDLIEISVKSSNPKVMIEAYRLLVARLAEEGSDWNYPIHLGVTEAGDGEDGRIKSSIGIGSLLNDGIGDTIRVSLTEDSVHEIPVAQKLVASVAAKTGESPDLPDMPLSYDCFSYRRRASLPMVAGGVHLGGEETIRVFTSEDKWQALAHKLDKLGDYRPEGVVEQSGVLHVDPRDAAAMAALQHSSTRFVTVADDLDIPVIAAFRLLAARIPERHPILLKDTLTPATDAATDFQQTLITSAKRIGSLLCDGIGDAILVQAEQAPGQSLRLAYNILQAAGARIFKTDYVACPSCGRTLFNLQTTTARIKAATAHLKGVKIAIMGCIVNGPGEMADADFGYVGGAPGKVNLYVGKQPVKFNIPEGEAVDRLKDLIREHGKWVEAPVESAEAAHTL